MAGAVAVVKGAKPSDDAGAETADAFEWQAAAAVADALALIMHARETSQFTTLMRELICEHHEDWLIVIGDSAELVSAKHRGRSQGPWKTVRDLTDNGGIGHLFAKWLDLDKLPTARLVTCSPPAPGAARKFEEAIVLCRDATLGIDIPTDSQSHVDSAVEEFARALLLYGKHLPDRWTVPKEDAKKMVLTPQQLEEARTFMSRLTILSDRPDKDVMNHAAPSLYVEPVLEHLGYPAHLAPPVWEALNGLMRIKMRARGHVRGGGHSHLLTWWAELNSHQGRVNSLRRRTVTADDFLVAISAASQSPQSYKPAVRVARPHTRLSIKMVHGECSQTSIERATMLLNDYLDALRHLSVDIPGNPLILSQFRRSLMAIADEVACTVASQDELYGVAMWKGLDAAVRRIPTNSLAIQLEPELMLGGICDLSNSCKVWFSEWFDVDAVLRETMAQL